MTFRHVTCSCSCFFANTSVLYARLTVRSQSGGLEVDALERSVDVASSDEGHSRDKPERRQRVADGGFDGGD